LFREAGIKLDSVVPDLTGKSAGLMTGALTGGERRGRVLADLAIGMADGAGWHSAPRAGSGWHAGCG